MCIPHLSPIHPVTLCVNKICKSRASLVLNTGRVRYTEHVKLKLWVGYTGIMVNEGQAMVSVTEVNERKGCMQETKHTQQKTKKFGYPALPIVYLNCRLFHKRFKILCVFIRYIENIKKRMGCIKGYKSRKILDFVLVRNADYGCYGFGSERSLFPCVPVWRCKEVVSLM